MSPKADCLSFYTGHIIDAVKQLGATPQVLSSEIQPIERRMRACGPAFAVEGRMNPDSVRRDAVTKILTMLGSFPEGHVAVYQTNDDEFAHFGDMAATALSARGCRGALIGGGCRDVSKLLAMEFPVFSSSVIPNDSFGGWELASWGGSVRIGNIDIKTGDYIFADADAIVVVPAEQCGEVFQAAQQIAEKESTIQAAIRSGKDPLTVFTEHKLL